MPESAGALNNGWIALNRLASLTGDPAARLRATAMIEKAAALDSGNSLTLSNASSSPARGGAAGNDREVDRSQCAQEPTGSENAPFPRQRRAIDRGDRGPRSNSPGREPGTFHDGESLLLAPRNPSFYQVPTQVLAFRRDAAGLRKIYSVLSRTELDLADDAKRAEGLYSGKKDVEMKSVAESSAEVRRNRPAGGPRQGGTDIRRGCLERGQARVTAASYGIATDPDAMVVLAEEAFASSPSLASRWSLDEALLFRARDRMAKAAPRFAQLRESSRRSVSSARIDRRGALPGRPAQGDCCSRTPTSAMPPTSYATHTPPVLRTPRARGRGPCSVPGILSRRGRRESVPRSELELLEEEIDARLKPNDPSVTLKAFFRAIMENKDNVAKKILTDAKARGVSLPVDIP